MSINESGGHRQYRQAVEAAKRQPPDRQGADVVAKMSQAAIGGGSSIDWTAALARCGWVPEEQMRGMYTAEQIEDAFEAEMKGHYGLTEVDVAAICINALDCLSQPTQPSKRERVTVEVAHGDSAIFCLDGKPISPARIKQAIVADLEKEERRG